MYVIADKNLQDEIVHTDWKREWFWSTCSRSVDRFPFTLLPPEEKAYSQEWKEFVFNLREHLCDTLQQLCFYEVERQ